MRAQGVLLNDCADMDMRSGSSSLKTEASTSPSVGKRSYTSSTMEKDDDDDEKPVDGLLSGDSDSGGGDGAAMVIDAPSDEEGGLEPKNKTRQKQKWELKDGMVQIKVSRERSPSIGEENKNTTEPEPDKHPTFENARLKWDTATAQLTKGRVDRLGAQSWHGKRRLQDFAPVKTRSAPRNSLRTTETTTKKTTSSPVQEPISTEKAEKPPCPVTEPTKDVVKSSSPPRQTHGNAGLSNGNAASEPEADEQSISVPTPATARSKFAAMSESANLESSTTSFLGELPKMPRRWRIDDDGSVASSVVRGGRVYRIQGPSTTKRFSNPTGFNSSKWTPRQSLPTSNSITSRTMTAATSSESSDDDDDDDDITEYDTVVPLNDKEKRGSIERTESGSSFTPSIATYDDFDFHQPLETVPSAGSKTDQQDPGGNTASVNSGQEESEYVPLNDAESYRKATRQEEDDEEEEEEEDDEDDDEEEEEEDYEEDLQDAQPLNDNAFVVDKVPKKRWTSRNIHNFPVWPPIIKVQTWDRKNVSAVSIGSGFSFDESLTNSNAVVSSLGDDDVSYEEEEFIRRPPEHRTSYRIRYDGPTSLNLENIYKTPIVDKDGRFESTKKPADGLPTMPARRITDSAPSAPPRISTSSDGDDQSVSLSAALEDEGAKRPDVWITPVSGALPSEPVWKVRRVWAVEHEDEKEQDHAVGNHELFEKIKSLVGAREGPTSNVLDNAPQLPQRSWHVRTVVEKRGRLENVEAEKSLDVVELQENIKVMAEEAVKEIASNQKVFEEYKKKRELQKAEEELIQNMEPVESDEEVDDMTTDYTFATGDLTSVPVDDMGAVSSVDAEIVAETACVKEVDDNVGEVASDKADDVAEASNVNAIDVDKTAKAETNIVNDNADDVADKATVLDATTDPAPDVVTSAADIDESHVEDAIKSTTTPLHAGPEIQPTSTSDDKDVSDENVQGGKVATNDEAEAVTDVRVVNDDETVVDTESVVSPTTGDVTEKKIKKKKKREASPKSSPKPSKDASDSADVPSTPVTTKQKRRSSTAAGSSVMHSPSPAVTPKKSSKSKSKSDLSARMSPKRTSKSSKELLTTSNDSPVQNSSTENTLDSPVLMTPKSHKSKTKLTASPKPKSPKREKTKSDTIRKGRRKSNMDTEKEEKETETPKVQKKVLSLAQLVRNDEDSSDNDDDSVVQSAPQSARSERRLVSKKVVAATNLTSPEPKRLSLAAMVHDTDSENEASDSDDEQSLAASIGPRIISQPSKSPRRAPGWWNTPGGTKRRSIPIKGTRPISPPLEKSNDT